MNDINLLHHGKETKVPEVEELIEVINSLVSDIDIVELLTHESAYVRHIGLETQKRLKHFQKVQPARFRDVRTKGELEKLLAENSFFNRAVFHSQGIGIYNPQAVAKAIISA